jgi:hypothetical protein
MNQLKDTTVRFGVTDEVDFDPNGDWSKIHVNFPSAFGAPMPGTPKGAAQQISVVATPRRTRKVAPVVVVKNVTATGFDLFARNLNNQRGTSAFSWLAALGVPDRRGASYDARLGVLQTKMVSGPLTTAWPGIWYSRPLVGVGNEAAILLTSHCNTGPCREGDPWRNAAVVASVYPMLGTTAPPDDGFGVGAVNVENPGRSGFYYASFIDARPHMERDVPNALDLWLDHGSEHNVEDSYQYNNVTWPTPPNRRLKPGTVQGDWLYLDVYFDRPFLTPPVVLLTARDPRSSTRQNPLAMAAVNVSTHGFTVSARNTDTVDAMAEFFWIAIGCSEGCG